MNKQDRKALEEGIEGWQEFCNSLYVQDDFVANRKQQLIEMAKLGEPRPQRNHHPFASSLQNYTNKNRSYDPKFDKLIRELAPYWFVKTSSENKRLLIEMAKKGIDRPLQKKHKLGRVLSDYSTKSTKSYDFKFTEKIKKLAPHWFVGRSKHVGIKKRQLINMAKRKDPRPIQTKHPLANALRCYTNISHGSYDLVFDKLIRKLAPHWFIRNKKAA